MRACSHVKLGRGFQPQDEDLGARTVIVSHTLRKTTLGGDLGIIGRTINLDREPYLIVGVAPAGFNFPVGGEQVQIWAPLSVDARSAAVQPITRQRGARMLSVMGRLRHGVSIRQAQDRMDRVAASLAERYPDENRRYPGIALQPALEDFHVAWTPRGGRVDVRCSARGNRHSRTARGTRRDQELIARR